MVPLTKSISRPLVEAEQDHRPGAPVRPALDHLGHLLERERPRAPLGHLNPRETGGWVVGSEPFVVSEGVERDERRTYGASGRVFDALPPEVHPEFVDRAGADLAHGCATPGSIADVAAGDGERGYGSFYPSVGERQNVVDCAHEGRGVVGQVAGTLRPRDGLTGDENETRVDVGRLDGANFPADPEVDWPVEILGPASRVVGQVGQ